MSTCDSSCVLSGPSANISYGCSSFAQDKECSIDPCAAVVLKEREKRNLRQVGPEEEVQYDESTEEKRWKQARLQ
jgi:hypothetical protein